MSTAPGSRQERELRIWVSEGLYALIEAEAGRCSCSFTGLVRSAIAKELVARARDRATAGGQAVNAVGGPVASSGQ
jgi:hypothetical protein